MRSGLTQDSVLLTHRNKQIGRREAGEKKAEDFDYLGPALAILRKRRNIPVESMADELGLTANVLSRCETRGRDFSARLLLQYLKFVGASLTELHVAVDTIKYIRKEPT